MNIQQYPLKKSQYFPDLTEKKFVVWHGTAGRMMHTPVSGRPGKATTSIDGWNLSADRVGAPWLVDRDGTIYQTFNDAAWIYHLGLKGTKGAYDKQSVAIEFANEGPLDLDGDRLYAFDETTPNTVYNGPFITHDWRGFGFFIRLYLRSRPAALSCRVWLRALFRDQHELVDVERLREQPADPLQKLAAHPAGRSRRHHHPPQVLWLCLLEEPQKLLTADLGKHEIDDQKIVRNGCQ
jgi:hypothetical protein